MRHILAAVLLVGITGVSGICAPVALQNATATFSQTLGSNFFASAMIDGDLVNGGWAIFDPNAAANTSAQTAAFETVADQGLGGGTLFTFTLDMVFGTQHTLGRFRISATTDNRSLFADGLQTGGDVTANWTVLTPSTALGTGGPTLTILGDGSVLASGTNPNSSVYTLTASTGLTGITGFRLEAMEDASLSTNGPGRQGNGNFVVTEFRVDQVPGAVPEPSSVSLLLAGCAGFGLWLRRRAAKTL